MKNDVTEFMLDNDMLHITFDFDKGKVDLETTDDAKHLFDAMLNDEHFRQVYLRRILAEFAHLDFDELCKLHKDHTTRDLIEDLKTLPEYANKKE